MNKLAFLEGYMSKVSGNPIAEVGEEIGKGISKGLKPEKYIRGHFDPKIVSKKPRELTRGVLSARFLEANKEAARDILNISKKRLKELIRNLRKGKLYSNPKYEYEPAGYNMVRKIYNPPDRVNELASAVAKVHSELQKGRNMTIKLRPQS